MSRWFSTLGRRRQNAESSKTNTARRSKLSLSTLEERTVPTVITVTNINDAGSGSLRQALADAALPANPGTDIINFGPAVIGAISLTTPLIVNSSVTIQGPGANVLSVSGNKSVRTLDVSDGASSTISAIVIGLTVKDGYATSGAGISVGQNDAVDIENCWLTGNTATTHGGGVDVASGGDLTIRSSTISDNSASTGGAVYFNGLAAGGSIEFRNSTISGNTGGGIALASFTGDAAIANSTIVYNTATTGSGGGIVVATGTGTISLVSSIVWGNVSPAPTGADIATAGTVNYNHTILGNSSGIGSLINQGGNLAIGTNPNITSLQDNGGSIPTHALISGSPAIDKGINTATACMNDERGTSFTRSFGNTDIGAYEYSVAGIPTVSGTFADVTSTGGSSYMFQLTFRDDVFINVANISTGQDISISGPSGFFAWAVNTAIDFNTNGTPRVATYSVTPPGGTWDGFDNGVYTVSIAKNAVYDNAAHSVPAGDIGQFRVAPAANSFLVTNANDNGVGSLRAALALANTSLGTADSVTFDPMFFNIARSIALTTGEIAITDPVTIHGIGASMITVNGNGSDRIFDINDGKAGGMFVNIDGVTLTNGITSGPGGAILITDEIVTLSNVVLTANRSTGSGIAPGGGAIAVTGAGSISAFDCTLTNNKATGPGGDGGAIRAADGSTIALTRCLVSGNTANGNGGGVYQSGTYTPSTLGVISSAIVNNSATDLLGSGGGLFFTGTTTSAVVRNSTISGNAAVAFGGGIGLNGLFGNLAVQNCTITDNSAGSASKGGGVGQTGGTGQIQFESTIISGNINVTAPDVYTTAKATLRTSALGSKAGISSLVDNGNNLPIGVSLNLGALANNGGPMPSHMPAANSLLVDRGSNPSGLTVDQRGLARLDGVNVDIGAVEIVSPGLPVAMAGPFADITTGGPNYTFVVTYSDNGAIDSSTIDNSDIRITGPGGLNILAKLASVDAPGNGSPRTATYQIAATNGFWNGSDAGLYTISLEPGQVKDTGGNSALAVTLGSFRVDMSATYYVTNANDAGAGSLRNAITLANITSAPDTIAFDPGYFATSRTIGLTTGELLITAPVSVQGTSAAKLTISGSNLSRVFDLNDGSAASSAVMSISNMTISGGKSGAEGGGIYLFDEQLSLSGVVVTNNVSTTGAGGGIFVASKNAVLMITDSTISQNTAGLGMSGGGIRIDGAATLYVSRTTISGNVAQLRGGGIYFNNGGNLLVSDSTISGNVAQTKDGGGAYFFGAIGAGGLIFRNSTISGNSAAWQGGGIAFVSVSGTPVFQNCTVTANMGNTGAGGISRVVGPNSIIVRSSIIAGNISPSPAADLAFDAATNVLASQSLFGVADVGNFTLIGPGNHVGNSATPLDPLLAPLANNAGPTNTHALKAGSPAINAGSNLGGLSFDQRGPGFLRTSGPATDIGALEMQVAPTITGFTINDGSVQRSRITSITIPFSAVVSFAGSPVNAFKLERTIANVSVGAVNLTADLSSSTSLQTVAKLTFSGPLTEFDSLMDGQYRLTVLAANVTDSNNQQLDGNGDNIPGGDFVTAPGSIFRLYGDINGDALVASSDFTQFRMHYGGGPYFAFDFDNDGNITATDFAQFRGRFGTSI